MPAYSLKADDVHCALERLFVATCGHTCALSQRALKVVALPLRPVMLVRRVKMSGSARMVNRLGCAPD